MHRLAIHRTRAAAPALRLSALSALLGCTLYAGAVLAAGPQLANNAPRVAVKRPAVTVNKTASKLPDHLRQVQQTGQMTLHVREGNLLQLPRYAAKVLVADPAIASFQLPSPSSVFVFGQAVGVTTLYALDAQDAVIAAVRVVVEHNLDALRSQITSSVPGAEIELEPTLNNRMIVRGRVRTPMEARQVVDLVQAYLDSARSQGGQQAAGGGTSAKGNSDVINQIKVEQSAQVNIQVRVVEVARTLGYDMGFNWATVLKPRRNMFGADTTINVATGASTAFSTALATNGLRLGANFTPSGYVSNVDGLLTALQEEGLATLLAEPNLTAMSGESAAFAAGGEVPIVIITNNSVQIDYKSYGVILRMTPTLLSPNRISLHIAPEVSELTQDGAVQLDGMSIPALKVRRADTTVELASGQSFALAGMLRSTVSQTGSGVPGLMDVPAVGRLFETEKTERSETELVILVTASVVDPVAAGQLQVPGQGLPMLDNLVSTPQAPAGYLY